MGAYYHGYNCVTRKIRFNAPFKLHRLILFLSKALTLIPKAHSPLSPPPPPHLKSCLNPCINKLS